MVLVQVQERVLCAVSSNTEGTCSRLGDNRHVRFLSSHPIHPRFHLALDNSPCTTYVEDTAGHVSSVDKSQCWKTIIFQIFQI